MLKRGTTKSALAARMGQSKQQIDRFFKLRHRSRADQIDAAFSAMGLTLESVRLVPTATVPAGRRKARDARRRAVAARKR